MFSEEELLGEGCPKSFLLDELSPFISKNGKWLKLREPIKIELEIVRESKLQKGFHIQPKRWVVERTFAWFSKHRRFSRDDEVDEKTSETMAYLAMNYYLVRRSEKSPNQ